MNSSKIVFAVLLAFFIFMPLVSSVQTEINPTYKKGETIIAKISGQFSENIQDSDVKFYRRHILTSISPYGVQKIGDDFYIYALISESKIPDNYSIVISNVWHLEGTQYTDEDIVLNFTLLDETTEFSVYPGAISTSEDFSIEVQNLQDQTLDIEISSENQNDSSQEGGFLDWLFGGSEGSTSEPTTISLSPGETEYVDFQATETATVDIFFSSQSQEYGVPAEIIIPNDENNDNNYSETNYTEDNSTNGSDTNETTNETTEELNETSPGETNSTEENYTSVNETFYNTTSDNITEEKNLTFWEKITGKNNKENAASNDEEIEKIENTPAFKENGVLKTCKELGGSVCKSDEKCEGKEEYAKDIVCCMEKCVKIEEKKNNNKIIGWALIIIVSLAILWFYQKKSKTKRKPVNLSKGIKIKK